MDSNKIIPIVIFTTVTVAIIVVVVVLTKKNKQDYTSRYIPYITPELTNDCDRRNAVWYRQFPDGKLYTECQDAGVY